MDTNDSKGDPFAGKNRYRGGEEIEGQGQNGQQGQYDTDHPVFAFVKKCDDDGISKKEYPCEDIMRDKMLFIGSDDDAQQAQAKNDIIPFAGLAEVQAGLVPKIYRTIENEQHARNAQQHPKHITVGHVDIIADTKPETRGVAVSQPQQQRHDGADDGDKDLEKPECRKRITGGSVKIMHDRGLYFLDDH